MILFSSLVIVRWNPEANLGFLKWIYIFQVLKYFNTFLRDLLMLSWADFHLAAPFLWQGGCCSVLLRFWTWYQLFYSRQVDIVVPDLDFLCACHLCVEVSKQAKYSFLYCLFCQCSRICIPMNASYSHFSFKSRYSPLLKEKLKNDCF